jgi:hypothetical protein
MSEETSSTPAAQAEIDNVLQNETERSAKTGKTGVGSKMMDLNDELDYEEEENQSNNTKKSGDGDQKCLDVKSSSSANNEVDDDSDGEIKSDNQDDLDEGEVVS